ncbi:MAG: glycosyltransferase family 4 protein [Verrucomicrobiales bacterium]|nr:glycosyltransferase family 4 protein [Verrucomicrobiales bacterium]
MSSPAGSRRVLWVDHVRRILGGAEVNLVELLTSGQPPAPWNSTVACSPDGPLHTALAVAAVDRRAFGFDDALGGLRLVGTRFPLAGAIRSLRALSRARTALRQLIAEVRPDVVVSCTNKDHFAVWPACRAAGVPSVWWVNDIVSGDFFPWAALQAFRHQARRGADRLVVVSEYARQALLRLGLAPERVVAIHNGIPLERYCRHPRGTLRRMLNLPENELLIGVLGRFTPWKGQELFVQLAEAWCRDSARGHFALIGHAFNEDQPFEARLREFVRERKLRNRVHFVPFQREVAAGLSDLDLLLHTSLKPEPFGRVIIEAMAVGVPVIAAKAGGVPEIIDHWRNGLLAEPGDVASYRECLARVVQDDALRATLAEAGRETVTRRFPVTRVRTDFDRLFEGLR